MAGQHGPGRLASSFEFTVTLFLRLLAGLKLLGRLVAWPFTGEVDHRESSEEAKEELREMAQRKREWS